MPNAIKRVKQEEKKVILAYAQLKLKANRLSNALDPIELNVFDFFYRSNHNLIIVQDAIGNSFVIQKIDRNRKNFESSNFKLAHNDLFNQFCTELAYQEYNAIGVNDDI